MKRNEKEKEDNKKKEEGKRIYIEMSQWNGRGQVMTVK